jgi:Domain of unknown function (DUF4129)
VDRNRQLEQFPRLEANAPLKTFLKRTRWLILPFAFVVLFPGLASSQSLNSPAPSRDLTFEEYIFELDRCSQALRNGEKDTATLHGFRASLPAEWIVKSGDERFTVSTEWLRSGLAEFEGNPRASASLLLPAEKRIATLREAVRELETASSPRDLRQVRDRLDKILSAREFAGLRGPSWWDVVQARIKEWFYKQFEKLFGHLGHAKAAGNVIAWGLILTAAILLAVWAVRLSKRGGRNPDMDLRGARPTGQDWHYWMREAAAAAKNNDYRAAIHAAYWAAVSRMEEANLLPEDRSRTPRESLRLIQRESSQYAPLKQLTLRFELVWYGYRFATAAEWNDAVQQLEKIGCPLP